MEKWIARLFGRRVVYLRDFDGEVTKRWAKPTPYGMVCRRMEYVSGSMCILLAEGKVAGPVYVEEWREAA